MQRLAGHKGLSQEGLKLIACASMLIDHVGATLLPWISLRIIGRLAFPIYCFLLAEGAYYTKNQWRYALRLGIGMILSELPFDYLFYGGWTWLHQSVMVTLFLAFLMAICMKQVKPVWGKLLIAVSFALAAEWLSTDYGGMGVLVVALFVLTREMSHGRLAVQTLGLGLLCIAMNSYRVAIGPVRVPIELFAIISMIFIGFYAGRKITYHPAAQWAFYLFYPCHMLALILVRTFC